MKVNCQCAECRAKRKIDRAARKVTNPKPQKMMFVDRVAAAVQRKRDAVAARLAVKEAR